MITAIVIVVVGAFIAWQAKRNMTFSVIALQLFLLAVVTVGALQLEGRQDDLEETQNEIATTQKQLRLERSVRSKVQAEINRYVCSENNKQDRILAGLIEVSVNGSSSFGSGIDPAELSRFDIEVLETIDKVQKLSQGQPDRLKRVFAKALRQLRAETPCEAIVQAFLEASDTNDLKAIRRILRYASADGKLVPPGPAHPAGGK
jgi:septal ring factor EnvC (AmiA/AmiB activator)